MNALSSKPLFRICLLCLAVFLSGCAQRNLGVGGTVMNCCITDFSPYASFDVAAEGLPAFLQPVVDEELTSVMTGKGLTRTRTGNDLLIRLSLNQEDLDQHASPDPFQGRLDPGGEVRFLADLRIEMVDTATNEIVWTGVLSRIHDVVPGAVMPLDSASDAIGAAFAELLANYPGRAP